MEDDQFMCDSSSSSTTYVTATGAFHDQQHCRRRALVKDTIPSALLSQGASRRIPICVRRAVPLPQLSLSATAVRATALRTLQHEGLGRHVVHRVASNQLGTSIPRAKDAPATERVRSTPLKNTAESWKTSGFRVINSRSTINDRVNIGARANPYGIYPVVFPFHGHSISSSNYPCQNTEVPRYTHLPRGQHHQIPRGHVTSRMALEHFSAGIMRRAGCFGLAKYFIPISTATYGGRAHSPSSSRPRKCGETRKPSAEVGKSKPDRQASLRIAESAVSSARAKAERSVGMRFNSGHIKEERGHYVRSSMIGNSKASPSSERKAPLPSGAKIADKLMPSAVQWRRGSITFPREIIVGSAGIGSQEAREIDTMGHKTSTRKATSISGDGVDSWLLTGIPLETQQQAGELLTVPPLNALRSDEPIETNGDESSMFFPEDPLPLRDGKDHNKTESMDARDWRREENDLLPNDVDMLQLSSVAEPQILQLSDVEIEGFDIQPRGNQESGSLSHEEHWLDVEAFKLLYGAEETLVPEVRVPSSENRAGKSLGELLSSEVSNTSERSKGPNGASPVHNAAPSGPPSTDQIPSLVKCTRGIQEQNSLASLPSWAHQPPILELDTEYSLSSLALSGLRASHNEDNPEDLNQGEGLWQRSTSPNKRKHRAKPGCTSTSLLSEPSLDLWTSMEGGCVNPGVEETELSGVGADASVGSRNTEQSFVRQRQDVGQQKCSSSGCQRRWAWESVLSEKAMEHSIHCCPPTMWSR